MAEKAQEKKQAAPATKESKVKVMAKSTSGAGTTLKVTLEGVPEEIIHGEILELNESQLQKLTISSLSWSSEPVDKKGDNK